MTPSPEQRNQIRHAIRGHMQATGKPLSVACKLFGYAPSTVCRWEAEARSENVRPKETGRGRPPSIVLTPEETHGLRGWCLLIGCQQTGILRWLEDSEKPVAERERPEFAPALPSTLSHLSEVLNRCRANGKRVSWPIAVRNAAQVSVNERSRLRGGHEVLKATPSARRSMIWIDESDTRHDILAGHVFSSDDMSHNEPFRYWDAAQGRETVGRQALLTCDLYSHGLIGETLIGRRKDAYRVEDIADHLTDVIGQAGLPLIWRFERGVWDNNFIYGVKPPPHWLLPDDTLFGALDGVLFRAAQKFTPRGKGEIENAFRLYQQHLLHKGTSVGTIRGEYKLTTTLYRQAIEGNPAALKAFWTIAEATAAHVEALASYHAKPQIRRAFGNQPRSPFDLWSGSDPASRIAHPASQTGPERRELPASEAWRLLPIKATGAVRQGVYECKVKHWPVSFRFLVSGAPGCPVLDNGHRVFAAFHPARPQDGCHLFNAEPKEGRSKEYGRRVNRDGFRLLEPLGVAAYWPDTAQENFAATAATFDPQRRASAALRSEFTAAFPKGTSLATRSKASDDFGRQTAMGELSVFDPNAARPAEPLRPRRAALPGTDLVHLFATNAAAANAEAAASSSDA